LQVRSPQMSSTVNEFTALWLSSCTCYHILTLHIEMAVAELRRLATSYSREGRNRYQVSPCEICVAQSGTRIGFYQSPSVFPVSIIPPLLCFVFTHVTYQLGESPSNRTRFLEGRQKRALDGTQTGNKRGFSHAALIFTS
jgi:hypothetical protein